jgi:hypothetical protein
MSSHAGDGAIEVTWPRCDVMSSYAGDDVAKVTWLRCNVDAESS